MIIMQHGQGASVLGAFELLLKSAAGIVAYATASLRWVLLQVAR
jgi:hypothetical protein